MADFSTPFGSDGEKRYPTPTESEIGHPCGPADRPLFNGLQHRVEAEIGHVIEYAGIVPTDERMTQLREAIENLIEAATGGGDPSQYVLMPQARARLPIFPEVLNVDGKIIITAPATGTVRLPGGVSFLHRGIFSITTAQTDFLTDPSKTYHLRWDPTNGFRLLDVAGSTYNPTALVETNSFFDSTYDNMLIARVITNASNIATITNLANKDRLFMIYQNSGVATQSNPEQNGYHYTIDAITNWARTPQICAMQGGISASTVTPAGLEATAGWITKTVMTRYLSTADVFNDYEQFSVVAGPVGYLQFNLAA